jgi:hypothetical protein
MTGHYSADKYVSAKSSARELRFVSIFELEAFDF